MLSDDSSELSSVPSDAELDLEMEKDKKGILRFFSKVKPEKPGKAKATEKAKKSDSPPPPEREPSPPHVYVLADNPDIAFIVMFRSRFAEAFPKSLGNFGPQELERDVRDSVPGELVEQFLCAVLGLLLNRKQDVKPGHYGRALEDAIQTHKSQWARDWESTNPLRGGATFGSMNPTQRLTLLRTLTLWSLSSSDVVKGMITNSYKQSRHEDDLNQPLSVQPWGMDGFKRRYYLIEGLDDTAFRVYRESTGLKRSWWSVAGDIEELKQLAEKLNKEDGTQRARTLSAKMLAAVPRFEATEDKRRRREYRQNMKNRFKRPEPDVSLYEGRTRGKRVKYTFSDDEDDFYSESTGTRRSTRNTGANTPAEPTGPTITQSGRQVKTRQGGSYGESLLSGASRPESDDGISDGAEIATDGEAAGGRPSRRAAAAAVASFTTSKPAGNRMDGYDSDDDDEEEQDYGDDDEEDDLQSEHEIEDEDANELDGDIDMEADGSDNAVKKGLAPLQPSAANTPGKKPMIKLMVSPEKKKKEDVNTTESSESSESKLNGASLFAKSIETEQNNSKTNGLAEQQPDHVDAPMSPTLAYRGSPQKSQN